MPQSWRSTSKTTALSYVRSNFFPSKLHRNVGLKMITILSPGLSGVSEIPR
jgi:hypothetical protein